jgi:hypothetical protein
MPFRTCIERHPNDIDAVIAMAAVADPPARRGGLLAGIEPTIHAAGRVVGRK